MTQRTDEKIIALDDGKLTHCIQCDGVAALRQHQGEDLTISGAKSNYVPDPSEFSVLCVECKAETPVFPTAEQAILYWNGLHDTANLDLPEAPVTAEESLEHPPASTLEAVEQQSARAALASATPAPVEPRDAQGRALNDEQLLNPNDPTPDQRQTPSQTIQQIRKQSAERRKQDAK